MSSGTNPRSVGSAPAASWVLLAFMAILSLVVGLSFAAVQAFGPRLPFGARQLASLQVESEVMAMALYAAWIAFPHADRWRYALETVLPIGLLMVGFDAAFLAATFWLNSTRRSSGTRTAHGPAWVFSCVACS